MTELWGILLLAALFLAVLLTLAADTRTRNGVTGVCALVAAVVGIGMYGYAYVHPAGLGTVPLLRALLSVCRMFGGVNDAASVQATPLWEHAWVPAVFWLGHFLAFYATASATVATLGGRLLKKLRTVLLKRGDLLVVFGLTKESVAFARTRAAKGRLTVLFADGDPDPAAESAAVAMGAQVEKTASALCPDRAFLQHIGMGPGKRKLHAAAMHPDGLRNLAWAHALKDALAERGVTPAQTTLTIADAGDRRAAQLMAENGTGFGTVFAFDAYALAARLMIRRLPPVRTLSFDDTGRATEDFRCAVVGFGQMGRAALAQLVMNANFAGSTFHADVFDAKAQPGSLEDSPLTAAYDIRFHPFGGKSGDFYRFLRRENGKPHYIVLSTGSDRENREIARELLDLFEGDERMPAIVSVTKSGILCTEHGLTDPAYLDICTSDLLDAETLDGLAMIVNASYCGDNGLSPAENWQRCDYFSRLSCRASADFAPAFLAMSGCADAPERFCPADALLENLAETEHKRWCAFHAVMGYRPMSEEVWKKRAERYAAECKRDGKSSLRIGKDARLRLHACLVPWDELDALSEKENRVTGGAVDYKAMDRNNVLALPALLRRAAEANEHGTTV
ncbi:MAG: hypothetical protein Q4C53_02930 [Clostridia bacterium]|nr:hypothetical protein [Clostridia bacterium]